MSTVTKERAELKAFITGFLTDKMHDDKSSRSLTAEVFRIALASLEAEPVCVIDQSNLDYLKSGSDADVWPSSRTEMGDVLLYRSAQPATVSVPAAMEMDDDFDSAFEHGKSVGWNAYRAAMLQGADGNSPVIPDGWVACSERMPEDEQEVITHNIFGYRHVSFFDEHSGHFFDRLDCSPVDCVEHVLVSHWMPLPVAPQQETK
ncbi:DUF551 domain-containing protein [Enterobacter kobei]|uniref:DUF551 domain-containing protein n=1 Tax=Enterobacter kobei TaxID=208224 RepID=UPI0039C3A259